MTPEQEQAMVKATQALDDEQKQALDKAQKALDAEQVQQGGAVRSANSAIASENDGFLDKAWKYPAAIARGTGEGTAATLDLPIQGAKYGTEWVKKLYGDVTGQPYERQAISAPPLESAYNAVMPAPPEGYEGVNDVASVVGPAVVETALSGGFAAPEAIALASARSGAKRLAAGLTRGTLRTAGDLGAGYVGGEGGRFAASQFTDDPEIINAAGLAGGFAAPAAGRKASPAIVEQAVKPGRKQTTLVDVIKSAFKPDALVGAMLGGTGSPWGALGAARPALKTAQWVRDSTVRGPGARQVVYNYGLDQAPTALQTATSAAVGGTADQTRERNPYLTSPNPISMISRLGN